MSEVRLTIDEHPLLQAVAFVSEFPQGLGQSPPFSHDTGAELSSNDDVRAAVRALLRHGGYKPTGRGKPSAEYLIKASAEGSLSSINPAVDVCNWVSLHSGLPISVVDLDRTHGVDFRIGVAAPGTTYVFNASGQTIDVGGLLCLFDGEGACANGVKDAHRSKTTAETRRTLSVVWGTNTLGDRTERTVAWYQTLLAGVGARTSRV